MNERDDQNTLETKTILWRGICGVCPRCGQGKVLRGYITRNDECSVCHEDFTDINADDAPPWLTILITGHLLAPLLAYFVGHDLLSDTAEVTVLVSFALICVFLLLPRSKGFFIAAIWMSHKR